MRPSSSVGQRQLTPVKLEPSDGQRQVIPVRPEPSVDPMSPVMDNGKIYKVITCGDYEDSRCVHFTSFNLKMVSSCYCWSRMKIERSVCGAFCRVVVEIDRHMLTKGDLMSLAPEGKVDNMVSPHAIV